jgi:hypothetical protein
MLIKVKARITKQTSQYRDTEARGKNKNKDKEQRSFAFFRGSFAKPCVNSVLNGFDLFRYQ